MENGREPATKAYLHALRDELFEAIRGTERSLREELIEAIRESERTLRDELIEAMRDIETKLLRAFYNFAESN